MSKPEIVIVGAGAAGLAAARALGDAGRRVVLLEARMRIGGRIWTVHNRDCAMPIELGAEFVHGKPPVTWRLIEEASLTACDVPWEIYERRGRVLAQADNY